MKKNNRNCATYVDKVHAKKIHLYDLNDCEWFERFVMDMKDFGTGVDYLTPYNEWLLAEETKKKNYYAAWLSKEMKLTGYC